MTISDLKQKFQKQLKLSEIDLVISCVVKKSVEYILSYPEFKLKEKQAEKIKKLIKKRIQGEPLAYISGKKEFFNIDFFVNKNVLIPRPETEMIVEETLNELEKENKKLTILDIGCGSGNIIISLSKNLIRKKIQNAKNIKFLASDISKKALSVARKNAKKNKQQKKIKFFHSDLLDNKKLEKEFKNIKKLIIVANLPYVPKKYLKQKETKLTTGLKYEPKIALFGGKDGLDFYKKLTLQILKLKEKFPKIKILSFYEIENKQKTSFENWKIENNLKIKSSYKKDTGKKWRLCKLNF